MVDFKSLKKNRSASFDKLNEQLTKMDSGSYSKDDRFWKPTVDKAGNGFAIIRFLMAPKDEDAVWVRMWDHGFKGPGGWYIENSLTTIGLDDPVSEFNSQLWNATEDDNSPQRKQARDQKRRLSYTSNILVVKDAANPSTEGKVYLYKYGKKIFDKLKDVMHPQFEDEKPVNPFDFWEGADFKLKIREVENFRNYDKSEFAAPGPIADSDGKPLSEEAIEALWNTQHSLADVIDKKNFKTYDELKAKMHKVLGLSAGAMTASKNRDDDDEAETQTNYKPKFKEAAAAETPATDDEDALDFFKNLANEDNE